MKRTLVMLIAVVALGAAALLTMGRIQSSAVRACRADAQRFAQENASYEAEYDSLFGATTLGQRSISEMLDRDNRLMECMSTDSGNKEQYRTVLYRNGFIEGMRFQRFMLDTQQMQDFAQWERNQQAAQLASYRKDENH